MALRASSNLSERQSLAQQRVIEGNTGRVSCFVCPAHGYAAVLGRRETLLENVLAEFESPAAHQNFIDGWVETTLGPIGFADFATTLLELYATMWFESENGARPQLMKTGCSSHEPAVGLQTSTGRARFFFTQSKEADNSRTSEETWLKIRRVNWAVFFTSNKVLVSPSIKGARL
jgi:hypothetical protein